MSGSDFRIRISRDKVNCEYDDPPEYGLPCEEEDIKRETLETILLLEKWIRRWEKIGRLEKQAGPLRVPETFKVLGNQLWELAFGGEAGRALIAARKRAAQDDETAPRIRVRIAFSEDARDLAALPWEFVRSPGRAGFFLAADSSLVLSRYVHGVRESTIRVAADEKVRILFVVSLPNDKEFDDERDEINALVAELIKVPELQIKIVERWSPSEVLEKLAEFRDEGHVVDVVHLVGVCNGDPSEDPMLYLPSDGSGGGAWLNSQPVVETLTHYRDNRPALVVLHLSEWDRDPSGHFEQLAPAFVRSDIVAVLAMQYPMPPEQGRSFVTSLYKMLAEGRRIGEAVQKARNQLFLGVQLNRQFGTPVLYTQTRDDGGLIDRALTEALIPESAIAAPNSQPPMTMDQLQRDSIGDTGRALLKLLDGMPPTIARDELRSWVSSTSWQADITAAKTKLRLKRRDVFDDVDMRMLCGQLIDLVDRLAGAE